LSFSSLDLAKSGHFQCQAFVTVSQKFDLKAILRDISGQLIPLGPKQHANSDRGLQDEQFKGFQVWDMRRLGDKLRSYLYDKRYLIVLDDIWSDSAWDNFKFFLPRNNFGSVIIVTTRIRSVANYCSHLKHDCSYEIEPLDQIEAKELFFGRLFGQVDGCPRNLWKVSEDISKKCGGFTYLPPGFGKLKSIQTLGLIEISDDTCWRIQEIGCLTQLRKLRIRSRNGLNKENWESLLAVIEKLSRCFRSLSIETDGRTFSLLLDFSSSPPLLLESLLLYERLEVLPTWVASLDNLVKLTLVGTKLKDGDIQVIQKLPRLFSLRLWFAFGTERFAAGCSGSPNLQLLAIQGWNGPLEMTMKEGAMQKLHRLVLVVSYRSGTLKSVKGTKYLQVFEQSK
ncbi:hypothetical protein BAE44_0020111, partial [Dichanthelium oligosanthes]